jgi:hypothetical protein
MSRGVWNTLDGLAGGQVPAAVLAEWRRLADGDFPLLGGFLRVTQRLAGGYPCLAVPDCGCRHELVQCDDTRWVARCQCEEGGCPPAWLAPNDLIIHELDAAGFGGAVARALGFGPPDNAAALYAAPKMWPVGTYAATRSAVYLGIFPSKAELFDNVAGLVASRPEPFILLMPTAELRSEAVDSFLARVHCRFVALAPCLAGDGRGSWRVTSPIEPVLKRFAGDLAQARNMGSVLEGIRREIAALRDEAIKPAAAAQPPTSQGEAERIFAVLQRLRSKRAGMMAPLYDVFVATVLEGRSQRAAAKSCDCSPALLSKRVGELEKEFRLPLKQLQNYAKTLLDMETSVKGQRYARKKRGAPQDEAGQYDEEDSQAQDDNGYLPEERQDDS